jgi:hypothetical protein
VLALDTFGGRPSQLANPQLGAGSPAHHGLRARGGRRSAPRAINARSRNERSPSLLAVTPPAWPGSLRTPRTPVSPKFAQLTRGRRGSFARVPGRSDWAPRLQRQGYPLGRIFGRFYRCRHERRTHGHDRGGVEITCADTSESLTAKSGIKKTRPCSAVVFAVACRRVAGVGWLLRPSPGRDVHAEVPHRGLLHP